MDTDKDSAALALLDQPNPTGVDTIMPLIEVSIAATDGHDLDARERRWLAAHIWEASGWFLFPVFWSELEKAVARGIARKDRPDIDDRTRAMRDVLVRLQPLLAEAARV